MKTIVLNKFGSFLTLCENAERDLVSKLQPESVCIDSATDLSEAIVLPTERLVRLAMTLAPDSFNRLHIAEAIITALEGKTEDELKLAFNGAKVATTSNTGARVAIAEHKMSAEIDKDAYCVTVKFPELSAEEMFELPDPEDKESFRMTMKHINEYLTLHNASDGQKSGLRNRLATAGWKVS